jgi:hypothetical protein
MLAFFIAGTFQLIASLQPHFRWSPPTFTGSRNQFQRHLTKGLNIAGPWLCGTNPRRFSLMAFPIVGTTRIDQEISNGHQNHKQHHCSRQRIQHGIRLARCCCRIDRQLGRPLETASLRYNENIAGDLPAF